MNLIDLQGKLPVHTSKKYRTRPIAGISRLVIHHTAGPSAETPEEIARFHVISDRLDPGGAPGIAYHYLVGPDGTVYKCWPAIIRTWCVENHNTESLCVCLIGNFQTAPPPLIQWDAAVELSKQLLIAYPSIQEIQGHREVPDQSTACPGVQTDMEKFRTTVRT